jgi:hypothetical protein
MIHKTRLFNTHPKYRSGTTIMNDLHGHGRYAMTVVTSFEASVTPPPLIDNNDDDDEDDDDGFGGDIGVNGKDEVVLILEVVDEGSGKCRAHDDDDTKVRLELDRGLRCNN